MGQQMIINNDIKVYGTMAEVVAAKHVLEPLIPEFTGNEPKDRLVIAKAIEEHGIKASILYKGNTVWNKKKLLANFRAIKKSGDVNKMTKYTYEFLHLSCGSIAHYNQHGWINQYPTITHLTHFFQRNEYGQSVLEYQPRWKTDAIEIVKEINKILGVRVSERRW